MRLGAMGFDVTAVGEPRRALDAATVQRFDLALIDLRMGPMDGVQLMEALHAHQRRLPVLIMTAHGTIDTAEQAVRRGAFDYLTKPFVSDELRTKIERALTTRRWARDRERLLTVGQTLASSGIMERVLDAVAQATVEATEAERCVVFQLERGRLVPMASAGSPPPSWEALEAAAATAMEKGVPITSSAGGDGEVGTIVAAPLVVQRGPTGALVIETPTRVEPTEDDLELLALFSSQAAIAVRNTHELERLRSGALAALGRMATQVAHEIKNPLAGLRLYARHLGQRLSRAGDAEGQELAGKIAAGVDHLADVVAEITAFGRPPELHRAPTNVQALLDECLELAAARFDATAIKVVREWDPACPEALLLDARELRKAFLNLIVNAFEALGGSGRLALTTSYAADAGTLTVTIEDTGVGMSEETMSRAFDLFYTTKPDGTGLGMSMARSASRAGSGTARACRCGCRWWRREDQQQRGPRRRRRDDDRRRAPAHARERGLYGAHGRGRAQRARRLRPVRAPRRDRGPDAPGRRRPQPDAGAPTTRPLDPGDRDHRVRIGAQGHGGDEGCRGVPCPGKAVRPRRAPRAHAERPRPPAARRREHRPPAPPGRPRRRQRDPRTGPRDPACPGDGRGRCGRRRQRADHRRERDRQGARRRRAPRAEPAARRAVGEDQLCRTAEGPHRVGAVRPYPRLLHGRHQRQNRPSRGGGRGLAPPRRDHGDAAGAPGEAPPRARGARGAPGRRRQGRPGGFPPHLVDQPEPRGRPA